MQDLKLQIPEGHEIDLENSDLAKGIVKFKVKQEEKKNTVTLKNLTDRIHGYIADIQAFSIYPEEGGGFAEYGGCRRGHEVSGHLASIRLFSDEDGQWFDENGNEVEGYLFYKPNNN